MGPPKIRKITKEFLIPVAYACANKRLEGPSGQFSGLTTVNYLLSWLAFVQLLSPCSSQPQLLQPTAETPSMKCAWTTEALTSWNFKFAPMSAVPQSAARNQDITPLHKASASTWAPPPEARLAMTFTQEFLLRLVAPSVAAQWSTMATMATQRLFGHWTRLPLLVQILSLPSSTPPGPRWVITVPLWVRIWEVATIAQTKESF